MAFEVRKISDVGVSHPVVARLGVQSSDLIKFIQVDEAKRSALTELYVRTLMERLLQCHKHRDALVASVNEAINNRPKPQQDVRVVDVPNAIGLQGFVESYLYEAKNFLRDLLQLFRIVYDCKLTDASAFTNLKGNGESDIVKWATAEFGADNNFTKLLKTEQQWVAQIIRKRNAVEHPGGHSGTLTFSNIRKDPSSDRFIPPTWMLTGEAESEILKDMNVGLDNMLTVAEDFLVGVMSHKSGAAKGVLSVYEIPSAERDPQFPIRLRVGPGELLLTKLGRGEQPASEASKTVRSRGDEARLLRQQDRAWREKRKREG